MFKYILICAIFLSACTTVTHPVAVIPLEENLITIEAPHGFEIFFDSGATHTARDYYISGSTVINGSYFGVTDSGVYYPAGLWIEEGREVSGFQLYDPNLSHGLFFSGNQMEIISNNQIKSWIASCLAMTDCKAFQAGPLVLSGNVLQDLGKSWHARESHERTLIGKTQSGKVYFFVFHKKVSLTQMGEQIRIDPRFGVDPITVLNLDGGPSTAYFNETHRFRENKKLPIFFRIK